MKLKILSSEHFADLQAFHHPLMNGNLTVFLDIQCQKSLTSPAQTLGPITPPTDLFLSSQNIVQRKKKNTPPQAFWISLYL